MFLISEIPYVLIHLISSGIGSGIGGGIGSTLVKVLPSNDNKNANAQNNAYAQSASVPTYVKVAWFAAQILLAGGTAWALTAAPPVGLAFFATRLPFFAASVFSRYAVTCAIQSSILTFTSCFAQYIIKQANGNQEYNRYDQKVRMTCVMGLVLPTQLIAIPIVNKLCLRMIQSLSDVQSMTLVMFLSQITMNCWNMVYDLSPTTFNERVFPIIREVCPGLVDLVDMMLVPPTDSEAAYDVLETILAGSEISEDYEAVLANPVYPTVAAVLDENEI